MRCLIVTEQMVFAHHLYVVLQDGLVMSDVQVGDPHPRPGTRRYLQEGGVDAVILDVSARSRTQGVSLVRSWHRLLAGRLPLMVVYAPDAGRDIPHLVGAGACGCHDRAVDACVLRARMLRLIPGWFGYPGPALRRGPLCVNTETRRVYVGGLPVPLSPLEFDILTTLMLHYQRVLTREDLLLRLYQDIPGPGRYRVLDVVLGRLRRKLASRGLETGVCTAWRIGYVMDLRQPDVIQLVGAGQRGGLPAQPVCGRERRRGRPKKMPA
ncbi:winged helix-turn-helix transcriptional regulator [Klebsiella aerogenes]|uniref:winged helix-turn-helix transcriptional regulator n=1 Tax=Klebsiella aerogenes TaxID=548 RepID=UPI002FFC4B34